MRATLVRCLLVAATVMLGLLPITPAEALAQRGSSQSASERQRDRQDLEAEIARRMAMIARDRLKLTDAQFTKLQQVNARFIERRANLMRQERNARFELRRQMRQNATPSDTVVERLLAEMLDSQRQRVVLLEQEQAELAAFLTPIQRARYLGLQEGFRREVDERRERSSDDRPARRGPPGME